MGRLVSCWILSAILFFFPNGGVAYVGRALACRARGRGFDSHPSRFGVSGGLTTSFSSNGLGRHSFTVKIGVRVS
jgi:hypothetical protein